MASTKGSTEEKEGGGEEKEKLDFPPLQLPFFISSLCGGCYAHDSGDAEWNCSFEKGEEGGGGERR